MLSVYHFAFRCRKIAAKIGDMSASQSKGGKSNKNATPSGPQDSMQYELCVQSGLSKAGQLNRVTELENRIKMLETVMGTEQKDKLVSY